MVSAKPIVPAGGHDHAKGGASSVECWAVSTKCSPSDCVSSKPVLERTNICPLQSTPAPPAPPPAPPLPTPAVLVALPPPLPEVSPPVPDEFADEALPTAPDETLLDEPPVPPDEEL